MTGLQRTTLTTPQKVDFAANALARQEEHGAKAQLGRDFGVSRPTVYATGVEASAALTGYFEAQAGDQAVLWVAVDRAQLERAVVALRVMVPGALRPIEDLIPILYPGAHLGYGTVQRITAEAEARATERNAQASLAGIVAGALDEMFSQGDPVLAGVDLDSGYLFALSLRDGRSGADWAEVLGEGKALGLELSTVVKDAALGIAAGVKAVFPDAEQRDDCFHALFEMAKVLHRLERLAYAAIEAEQEAERRLGKIRAIERDERRSQKGRLAAARRKCREAIALHDAFERAMRQAHEAMEFVDLRSGELRTAEQVRERITDAAAAMRALGKPCRKVAVYLGNRAPGLALAMAELHGKLTALGAVHGERALSLAGVIQRLERDLDRCRRPWQRAEQVRQLRGAYVLLGQQALPQAKALMEEVATCLEHHHRASSATEGFKAALRPHLCVHKGTTQGFLELFRFRYDLRVRRWGRHRSTSAHQCLTGRETEDWLAALGYPPSRTIH